ncbi:ArsR/SmtB family transcription factor [Breznakiella homolactica]|uniref:Winged helix-turn-helix transcriptional regulator n=1 Tax=Breznakiella homolactica TaxID=2798577 RepID=A0A7T7XK83_9SPIR|nr:metalloregulator ArsR/SmtB family transcription factor [Breznakiella homolactica]QQO07891.1 metalloregulator ArsR/SmtB family transcription factor [Breznakiella homolactica]
MINQKEIKKAAEKFKHLGPSFIALGDENRQRIVLILAEAGVDGMNVSDITDRCHLSRPAISHHLKILKDAGIISSYKKGTQVFYYIYLTEKLAKFKDLISTIETILSYVDQEELKQKAPWIQGNRV